MFTVARRAYAAVLLLIFSLAWIPLQAFAQLPPPCVPGLTCPSADTTPPTVRITSPASGATVSGTISVTADASDNVGVAGVQFFLDDVLGADDTTAPYSVPWDTASASNGSHTLTAVARDAAGNRTTSDPVTITVSHTAPAPAVKRFEETDGSVSFSAGWTQDSGWPAWSGGTAMYSSIPGAQATFTFIGTSATWIGVRSDHSGIARVFVDGVFVSDVDMFERSSTEVHVPVFTARGLANGSHTLAIEVTGLMNMDPRNGQSSGAMVVVDAFDVPTQVVSHLQDTDPDMTYTAGWTGGDTSRYWSGGYAHVSTTAGAQATLTFNGTSISWIGYRGPDAGIARVFLDGVFAGEVDLYYSDPRIQAVVLTSASLADASHTLMIEATGLKNAAASDARVVVDAFDVTKVGTRFEDTDGSVTYTGDWWQGNRNKAWSMGTVAVSNTPGARATFTFTGTSVSWIGCRKFTMGIANVYLDGVFVAEIDTFVPLPAEGYQNTIFEARGLASGSHTLTIEATGRLNPAATNSPNFTVGVVVDAFDVRP